MQMGCARSSCSSRWLMRNCWRHSVDYIPLVRITGKVSICYRPSSHQGVAGCRVPGTVPRARSKQERLVHWHLPFMESLVCRRSATRGTVRASALCAVPALHSISLMCELRHQKFGHAALRNLIVGSHVGQLCYIWCLVSPESSFRHHFNLNPARQSGHFPVSCRGSINRGLL